MNLNQMSVGMRNNLESFSYDSNNHSDINFEYSKSSHDSREIHRAVQKFHQNNDSIAIDKLSSELSQRLHIREKFLKSHLSRCGTVSNLAEQSVYNHRIKI
ncbi:hypothetical protein QR98_0046830 [Sarcoptes scabiei]|uniref:Uncharacterized protein n=1 Tax=Sarcoptes scabiei TaxID=52283 RepID=A0A132A720_SARSC|nr:hypothetical protein QR98_0046830 [Sarcoptes scabiei]